jgi:hypothetical protein
MTEPPSSPGHFASSERSLRRPPPPPLRRRHAAALYGIAAISTALGLLGILI